jgi:hypothetical protein
MELEQQAEELLQDRFWNEFTGDLGEAREWIWMIHGSHQKMGAIMDLLQTGEMAIRDWFMLLGEVWTACDLVWIYRDDLVEAIYEHLDHPLGVIPELMNPDEQEAFQALPEEITVYRGCGPVNMNGLSWTLSREIAVQFPFNRRYETDQPTLLTATVSKYRAAALKLERNEQEVILIDLPASSWSAERLASPPPKPRGH